MTAHGDLPLALQAIEGRLAEALRLADGREEFLIAALISEACDAVRRRRFDLTDRRQP